MQHFGFEQPIWAVSAPNADVGGLVNWANARRGDMSDEGRLIFEDLDRLGIDLRTRPAGDDAGKFRIK